LLGALIYTLIVAWDFSDLIRDMKK